MILVKGELLPDSRLPQVLDSLEEKLLIPFQGPPLERETVLDALEQLEARLDRGELDPLIDQYAPPGTLEELEEVRWMLRRETLEQKLAVELGTTAPNCGCGRKERLPLGVLLHVAAGNMPGLPVFSVMEGLLAGNVNLLKLPREDKGLSLAVLQQLVAVQPKLAPYLYAFDLPSRDTASLQMLAHLADGIVTWGGDSAISAMRSMAPPGCKLIEWGHRLSFAYLSGWEGRTEDLRALADHIIYTGGLLCSSCQVLYLDSARWEDGVDFCRTFLPLLEQAAAVRRKTPGQAGHAALYAYETLLEHVVDWAGRSEQFFPGRGCSLTLCRGSENLELSPLYGNVLVKCLPQANLVGVLRRNRGRLQTAGLLCPPERREALARLLARSGVNRITTAGHMSRTWPGEAHDGEYPLQRYTRIVDIE